MSTNRNDSPLVSVIVPVYNGAAYLRDALDSIIAQSYENTDIVVVDDGSTDTTATITRSYSAKLSYMHQSNQGPAAARNLGIRNSSGSLVSFLDADDLWLPEKLKCQIDYLAEHPECQCVAVKCRHFIEADAHDLVASRAEWLKSEYSTRLFSGLCIRRGVFDLVGFLEPNLRFGEDIDWLARLDDAEIDCPVIDQVLVKKRIHRGNVTHQTAAMTKDTMAALRRGLQRKRVESE